MRQFRGQNGQFLGEFGLHIGGALFYLRDKRSEFSIACDTPWHSATNPLMAPRNCRCELIPNANAMLIGYLDALGQNSAVGF
jgi:hypothetical protein